MAFSPLLFNKFEFEFEFEFLSIIDVFAENQQLTFLSHPVYTVSKNCANLFCQKFVKFPPILTIFGRKMVKRLKLCEVHSFLTSSNLRHYTAVLNADVPNTYTTLKVVICNKLSKHTVN